MTWPTRLEVGLGNSHLVRPGEDLGIEGAHAPGIVLYPDDEVCAFDDL